MADKPSVFKPFGTPAIAAHRDSFESVKMAGAFAVRLFRQLTFFGESFHYSYDGHLQDAEPVAPCLFESFLRSFAVDNPVRLACNFIRETIIHSEDLVNININTHARK
ncbi:hypothetical protein SAMN04488490_0032 [Marinobacter sp. LV10R510-11A]|uniref:hypothetical protein n=1 Tax=Marinobacter sp. LV10R510-11A TaxID=1415568 RepID=UPI000BC060BE|nr:hypothetical protein [Marinobacter sp. LV10R510-11A]SOB74550.1 hypothetical protein SAMN04488490_0032 [Marinobacter sp. LV10R510-11A]